MDHSAARISEDARTWRHMNWCRCIAMMAASRDEHSINVIGVMSWRMDSISGIGMGTGHNEQTHPAMGCVWKGHSVMSRSVSQCESTSVDLAEAGIITFVGNLSDDRYVDRSGRGLSGGLPVAFLEHVFGDLYAIERLAQFLEYFRGRIETACSFWFCGVGFGPCGSLTRSRILAWLAGTFGHCRGRGWFCGWFVLFLGIPGAQQSLCIFDSDGLAAFEAYRHPAALGFLSDDANADGVLAYSDCVESVDSHFLVVFHCGCSFVCH